MDNICANPMETYLIFTLKVIENADSCEQNKTLQTSQEPRVKHYFYSIHNKPVSVQGSSYSSKQQLFKQHPVFNIFAFILYFRNKGA